MSFSLPCSIASAYYREFSPEEMVQFFLKEGFFHTELAFEHVEQLICRGEKEGKSPEEVGRKFRSYLEENFFCIPQGHLSFQSGLLSEGVVDVLKKQLDLFRGIGIQAAVLHLNGGENLSDKERLERKMQCLWELKDYVKGTPMVLCIENLTSNPDVYSVEQILGYIEKLGEENLGICLDTGHLHLANAKGLIKQSQREFILGAGKHLKALHVANNDGCRDQHLMPFTVSHGIHWDEVIHALNDSGYQGLFNLEIGGETSSVNCPFAVKQMKIKYLRQMTEYMFSEEFFAWHGNN